MNNKIETKVNGGKLVATIMPDPENPGISIDFVSDEDGVEYSVALVEKTNNEQIRTLAWCFGEEDYVGCTHWEELKKKSVEIIRNGIKMKVGFEDIKAGDFVFYKGGVIVASDDAHYSGDASYDGYLFYDTDGEGFFPEDF